MNAIKMVLSGMEYVPPNFLRKALGNFLWEGIPENKGLALTFDDGPDPEITPLILDVLAEKSARGTFFLTGKNTERYPDTAAGIASEGHLLGNHSFDHRKMFFMKKSDIEDEIINTQTAIFDCTGIKPVFFRPPYGSIGLPCIKTAGRLGMKIALWTVLAGDYGDFDRSDVLSRVEPFVRPGAIIVFHDTLGNGGYDLPGMVAQVCDWAKEKNISLLGLDEILFRNDLDKEAGNV